MGREAPRKKRKAIVIFKCLLSNCFSSALFFVLFFLDNKIQLALNVLSLEWAQESGQWVSEAGRTSFKQLTCEPEPQVNSRKR